MTTGVISVFIYGLLFLSFFLAYQSEVELFFQSNDSTHSFQLVMFSSKLHGELFVNTVELTDKQSYKQLKMDPVNWADWMLLHTKVSINTELM